MDKRINFRKGKKRKVANLQFWLRVLAFAFDSIIIRAVFMPISFRGLYFLNLKFNIGLFDYKTTDSFWSILKNNLFIVLTIYLIVFVLYSTLLESSKLKATIGKRFLRFTVHDMEGKRISFRQGFSRNILKIFSITTIIGVMIIDVTRKRQALHDLIAGTVIVKR